MRILWITPGFAANEQDTTCIPPLYLLAREFVELGVDLRVIALEYPGPGPSPSLPPFGREAGGGAGTIYPCNGQNRRYLRWRTFARARKFAAQIISEKETDLVHSFWLGPAWAVGRQVARRWNIPQVCTLMGQDVLPQNRYLRRLKSDHAEQLIALSPFHDAVLENTSGLRAKTIIPWGIPEEEFAPTLPGGTRPVDVLGVGSLIPVKNWARWLAVLSDVVKTYPSLQAELIGDGTGLSSLRKQADALGLSKNVRFTGSIPRPAVLARMQQSKLLLHTANFESFGYVFAEARANGCAVVSTPVGAAPELGICATTDGDLAAAVLQVLAQPEMLEPKWIYRMEDTAAAYLDFYRLVVRQD